MRKPMIRDCTDDDGNFNAECYESAMDDYGDSKYEEMRDRQMEEEMEEEVNNKDEAIKLIKELLKQIESGEVVVDGIGIQNPEGGYVLKPDGTILDKITELKLTQRKTK